MSIELQVLNQIKKGFNLSHDEAEAALLLLTLRARNLDISFEQYIKTYHPKGLVQKDNSLNPEYKGYVKFLSDDAKSIIRVGKNADFSTFVHENAHVFRRQLSGKLKEQAEKAFKVQSGNWTEAQEEAFAIGFEEYVCMRLYGSEELKEVFEKGSVFMQKIYNGLDRIIELNPEIIKVYEQMFTEGRFQFDKSLFDKTIDNIANFKNEPSRFKSSHVYLGMTPPIYQELGFERLPVMITAKHLQNIMSEGGKDKNTNYHGLSADMVKQIPEAIKKPLLIMQSQNAANAEDVIAVIELKDKEGRQIIVPFSPNKKGYFTDVEIDINLAKTIYGRTGFNDFIRRAIKENRILYINEKSRELTIPEIQFLRNRKSQLLYDNISKYQEDVNNANLGKLYQKVYHGSRYDFDEFNSSYIGSGEGASGWGYGFYFSEDKADAADYARKLEYEDGDGRVYTVSIPSTRHFFDISRDMYFEDQSKEVKTSLKRLNKELKNKNKDVSFASHSNTFFKQLQEEFNTEYKACEYLKKAGIKGITHTEFGNRHFIVFDDENIKVSKKQNLKNLRILYQNTAYYSGGQLSFDFLNDPVKENRAGQETFINENKTTIQNSSGVIFKTGKIKIIDNKKLQRVQIFFPSIPDISVRDDLKAHGWRWSPSNFCWQRLNTENGIKDAKRFFDTWYNESLNENGYNADKEKTDGKDFNQRMHDRQGNGYPHMGRQVRSEDDRRTSGVDAFGAERGRTSFTGKDGTVPQGAQIPPNSFSDEQRGRGKMGFFDEPQNEQGSNGRNFDIGFDKSGNGLISDEKKSLKDIKAIRSGCIKLLNSKQNHEFTEDDKKLLSQYEGAGGTGEKNRSASGILYEYYTPNILVNKVWQLVDSYAPNAKTVLEPSGGTGRFIAGRNKNECTLIESDKISSRIAFILHPQAEIKNQAFQELFFKDGVVHKQKYEGKKYDIVIGNPPYGEYSGLYKGLGEGKKHSRYEQYFIERGLDTLNENGILAFVMPSSFLRSGENEGKRLIASKGELIDAWRLPNGLFGTTDVGTDIVVIKKGEGNIKDFCLDSYFDKNKAHVLGEEIEVQGRFGKEKVIKPFDGKSIEETLNLIEAGNFSFNQISDIKNVNSEAADKKAFITSNNEKSFSLFEPLKAKVLSAKDFARTYGMQFDEREMLIWKQTDYEGKINTSNLSLSHIDFMNKNPAYIKLDEKHFMHMVNYAKGNIYEKLEELEKQKSFLDTGIYLNQKNILTKAIPEKIPYEKINIPVHSSLAEEFIVGAEDGISYNLKEGFIKWTIGEEEQLEALKNDKRNHISSYYLDYEYSPLRHEDFPSNVSWNDVLSFIDGTSVTARRAYSDEDKKAAKIEAQKLRVARRETAERLFNKYIQEGIPEELKHKLEYAWNRRFNGYVSPDYAKLPLFIDGMSITKDGQSFSLYKQQIKGISFLSNKGNGLLAYDVGVGKTACGIVGAVNQIQSGRAKRPLICVPKAVYSKWIHDTKELFPNIKINELGNFSEENLKPFITEEKGLNIEEGSISFCTHEALQNITFEQSTIDLSLMADLLDARADYTGNARLDAIQKEKIKEILGVASSAKDNYIFWEKTGFDHITVDEAHRFKNLFTMPKPQNEDDKKRANEFEGIGSGTPSKRAQKLFAITQLIQRENNGCNVHLLTATPFTNSPTEVYSMLSYVARQKLKDMHLYNLGAFMTEFAETKTEWAVKPSGDIQPKQVMKNFKNLKSLQNLLTEYIDKVDAEEAGVIRPIKIPHTVELEASDIQKKIIEAETNRMSQNSKEDPGAVLVAMNNMRMGLLSPSLLNQYNYEFELPPIEKIVESSPKLTFVCNSIIESYKGNPQGGQVMYMPRGVNEFQHVKNYLVKYGIPESSIALISSETSSRKKDEITAKFNNKNDKLKIIIGSETISEGIDLNGNSFALYNCMLGWNPTENIQVEGRIWRQENEQGHVHITYPLIYDSIDSLMYQKHDEKSSRINDLWSYKGDKLNVEDIHPEELKFDLIKDPEKKASLLIEQKTIEFKKEIDVIDMKLHSLDEIITLKFNYKESLKSAIQTENKKSEKFYKRRITALEKKSLKFGIEKEGDEQKLISSLNSEKSALKQKIEAVTNDKDKFIKQIKEDELRKNLNLKTVDEYVKFHVASVLGNLKPMEEVKAEIKRKNNTRDSEKNTSFLDRLKEDKEYTKNYKSAIKSFLGNSFSIGNNEKRTSADKAVCMER